MKNDRAFVVMAGVMTLLYIPAISRPTNPPRPTMYLDIAMNNSTCTVLLYGDAASQPHVHQNVYDHKGAMYFAVAVISMYGISIALLIGSTLRRDDVDYELKGFLRSFAKVDIDRRKKEKYRIRQVLKRANFIFHPPMERKMYLANLQNNPPGSRRSGSSTPGQSGSGVKTSKSQEFVKSQVLDNAPSPLSVISEGDASSARKSSSKTSPETHATQGHDVHTAIVHTSSPERQDGGHDTKMQPLLLANPQQTFVTIQQAERKSFRPLSEKKHNRVIVRVPAVCPARLLMSSKENDCSSSSSAGIPNLSENSSLLIRQPASSVHQPLLPKRKQKSFKRQASHQKILVSAPSDIATPQNKLRSHSAYDLRGTFRQTAC